MTNSEAKKLVNFFQVKKRINIEKDSQRLEFNWNILAINIF
jgi:hypothetical protein